MTILSFAKTYLRSISAGILSAALIVPGIASAQDKSVTWRVQSHWPASSSSYEDSLVRIKNIIEKRTEGRVKLQLFEAGALFKAPEIFNAVSRGVIQMGTISPAYAQDKMSLAGIASGLPFAFRNVWEVEYFHMNMGFEQMLQEEAAKHGVYYSTDKVYPTEMVLKKPINSMDDLKKLKIRSSGALQKFLTEAGAAGTYLPGGELYPALSSGVVDGAHWGAAQGAASMNLYEVAKYHVKPALNIAGTDAFIINQKALEKLSAADQKTVKDALKEQFYFRTVEYLYKEEIALSKAVREKGVKINNLPDDVAKQLATVAQKTWDEEGKRSEQAAKVVKMIRGFLTDLGYL